jgi:hypothetical protein
MVELQIVILAVAGSSPVGHPSTFSFLFAIGDCSDAKVLLARSVLKEQAMLNPAVIDCAKSKSPASDFWLRLVNDEQLRDCDDLEKLLIGCEIIAALDAVDLLAA